MRTRTRRVPAEYQWFIKTFVSLSRARLYKHYVNCSSSSSSARSHSLINTCASASRCAECGKKWNERDGVMTWATASVRSSSLERDNVALQEVHAEHLQQDQMLELLSAERGAQRRGAGMQPSESRYDYTFFFSLIACIFLRTHIPTTFTKITKSTISTTHTVEITNAFLDCFAFRFCVFFACLRVFSHCCVLVTLLFVHMCTCAFTHAAKPV